MCQKNGHLGIAGNAIKRAYGKYKDCSNAVSAEMQPLILDIED
ncbi:MAG: hypothetical protein WA667_02775 [Candidatus Nitrosopolaris sp.]